LEPTQIRPTRTHALMGSVVALVFHTGQILSDNGWGPDPSYDPSLAEGDHVNNHISLGVPPPNTDTQTLCQVKVTPHKSEGIEPFTLVNSLPGQVEVSSSHQINLPSGQVRVIPHKSEGIEPFTMVNSPLCQVGVTPRSPGSIEPSALVNSLPGQVRPHPHTRSTLHWVFMRSHPWFHLMFQFPFHLV